MSATSTESTGLATDSTGPARPGRPRSERARLAIMEAAADLLIEGGLSAATIEAIAARACVSKVTIYKWWPTRGAVAIDAYFHRYRLTITFEDTGDVTHDLAVQIEALADAFRDRAGEVMAELIGQAQSDVALAEVLRDRWFQPRREMAGAVLQRGIDRGQIRPDADIEIVLDQLYAPLYYRLIVRHQPLGEPLAPALVRNLLDGVRPQ
ncbi:MAG: TetR/AcrR family transcriptional regulator [Streptosporangiaceae bacterium]